MRTGQGFAYDGNGNPTTYAGATCTYDVENHLTGYGNALTTGYRGDGKRAWKDNGTTNTYYLYDGDNLFAEYGSNGTVTAALSWVPAGLFAYDGTQYQFDQQGNVVTSADTNGQLLSTHWFDAHGTEQSTASTEPFGYKGQFGYYTDRETGLILCTHRYLDSESGRWLTRDPIAFSGGVNLYSYSANRPARGADPTGLDLMLAEKAVQAAETGLRTTAPALDAGATIAVGTGGATAGAGVGAASGGAAAVIGAVAVIGSEIVSIVYCLVWLHHSHEVEDACARPALKPGSSGGPGAGLPFERPTISDAMRENEMSYGKIQCVYCGTTEAPFHIDHVVPRSKGGNNTLANAQVCCAHCNCSKGARPYPVNPPAGHTADWGEDYFDSLKL